MEKHPFDFLDTQETGVTIEEAAKRLNLGRSTIYKYIKENKLEVISKGHSGRILISENSLASIEGEYQSIDESISLFKLSQELNISRERILAIAAAENIELVKGHYGSREQYIISPGVKEQLIEALQRQPVYPKSMFYNRAHGIALHQLFYSRNSSTTYRISFENGLWGIRTPAGLIPYEEALLKYQLEPAYHIQGKYRRKAKNCEVQIALTDPSFYKVIDTLYIACSVQNLEFRIVNKDIISIQVREGRYPVKNSKLIEYMTDLKPYLVAGTLHYIDNLVLSFISEDVELRLSVSPNVMANITERAKELNKTNDEYIQMLIERDVSNLEG